MTTPIERIRAYHRELTEIRRDLHAHPELSFTEQRTSGVVAQYLHQLGVETHTGLAKTGVVGVIPGKKNGGRAIALRADMDCLPMHEQNSFSHKSRYEGRMHACGHDGHTTMLLGGALPRRDPQLLRHRLHGLPASRGRRRRRRGHGEGRLFERFPADEVYAVHNWPGLPAGQMAVRAGPVMAATDEVQITLRGRGGHGAMPQLVDPVVAAAQVISALQTIASRNVSPLDSVVVSICSMQTSQLGAFNVIPEHVRLVGTVRSFRPETRDLAEKRLREITTKIAEALGCSADVSYTRGYPATINSAREAQFAARVGERVFGKGNVITEHEPTMGGEDFSYMLQARPGAYVFLGQGGPAGLFSPQSELRFQRRGDPAWRRLSRGAGRGSASAK